MNQSITTPVEHVVNDLELDFTGPVLGDEILLASAASTKVAKVRGGRSTESRAWSFGGNVD